MSRKRIIVTGGNGFVGRPLVRRLYADHDVCAIDRVERSRVRFGPDELSRFQLAHIDICDAEALGAVIREFRPDAIIHLAAIHYIPECEQNPVDTVAVNVGGTVNLLKNCPPACRMVFASSGAVYRPDTAAHDELSSVVEPSDIYGMTKWQGEQYTRYLAAASGFPAVVVRLFNVVGPGETNPHLLPEIVAQLKAGRTCVRLGNLTTKRDYIHVSDAAAGFAAAAVRGEIAPGNVVTVNLGTSVEHSVREVLDRLRIVSGIEFGIEQESARIRAVDRPRLRADNTEIRRRFGWEPRFDLDQALRDLWRDPDMLDHLVQKYVA
ncbi:NAD-dependent epimerase/dehydratase family protein (plasmid) [Skermanella rosea]|nr:NAD-dependent epimerase/dehydratase family protein [Skermanella rosea]